MSEYGYWEKFKQTSDYEVAYHDWIDELKANGYQPPFDKEEFDQTTAADDAYFCWKNAMEAIA